MASCMAAAWRMYVRMSSRCCPRMLHPESTRLDARNWLALNIVGFRSVHAAAIDESVLCGAAVRRCMAGRV